MIRVENLMFSYHGASHRARRGKATGGAESAGEPTGTGEEREEKGGKQALCGISFAVREGEIFGFLGPNGSGKSTTQKILTGILKGYGGRAQVLGQELSGMRAREFYAQIGVLFEFPYLYANLSALDNLNYFASFYPQNRRREAGELLEELELKPDFWKKPVSSCSKGMRQRVSMARALIHNPRLLFLDEPTSGLDPSGAVLFRRLIEKERAKGTTVFLTTHNMMDADLLCDRVAFLSGGRIAALDTPENLKEKGGEGTVTVDYLYQGRREQKILETAELSGGLPFDCDRLLRVQSREPSLEEVFIRCTGRGLA